MDFPYRKPETISSSRGGELPWSPGFSPFQKSQCVDGGAFSPGEEVGEALDMLPEATGRRRRLADSPTAAPGIAWSGWSMDGIFPR